MHIENVQNCSIDAPTTANINEKTWQFTTPYKQHIAEMSLCCKVISPFVTFAVSVAATLLPSSL